MKIINIITQELKTDLDKKELELESIVVRRDLTPKQKVKMVKKSVKEWREAHEDLQYWGSFVEKNIMPPQGDEDKEEEND